MCDAAAADGDGGGGGGSEDGEASCCGSATGLSLVCFGL